MISRSLIYFQKTQVLTKLKISEFSPKARFFSSQILIKCFFRLPMLGNSFLHFSQLKTWVSCFMFFPLCFSRFQGSVNSFSHVSHWNRIWKHWLRKTKCKAKVFHHNHPHFTGNFHVIRSFFFISPTEKPPKINFGAIALFSEPIGSLGTCYINLYDIGTKGSCQNINIS